MTDSRLLQLKRAWEASGSVEDEAAWLRERVRTGDLAQEQLELAVYCGSKAAACFSQSVDHSSEREWLNGLDRWKDHLWVLLAVGPVLVEVGLPLMQQDDYVEGYLEDLARSAAAYEEFLLSDKQRQAEILIEQPGVSPFVKIGYLSLPTTPGDRREIRRVTCEVVTDCMRHGPRRRLAPP